MTMQHRIRVALVTILLAAPLAAHAQPAPTANAHPAPAPAAASPSGHVFPDDAVADAGMWLDDDAVLGLGLGDMLYTESADLDGDGGAEPAVADDAQGPGGPPSMLPGGARRGALGMRQGLAARRAWLGGRPLPRRGMMLRLRLAQLDLSDSQREKLRDLHEAQARKAIQRRADVQLARLDLRRLMRAERPDPAAVNSQIDRLTRLQAEGLKSAFDTRLQARAVLTPEQLRRLRSPMPPVRQDEE